MWVVVYLLYDFLLPPLEETFQQPPRLLVVDCDHVLQTDDQLFLQGSAFAQGTAKPSEHPFSEDAVLAG
jgi:hypothetical protein